MASSPVAQRLPYRAELSAYCALAQHRHDREDVRASYEREIAKIECRACVQRQDAIRADAAGRDDIASRYRENAAELDDDVAAVREKIRELEGRCAVGYRPPDEIETLEHAHALHKLIGSKGTARVRRHLHRARADRVVGRVVGRARGRRPSGRPRARRTARATRAGPSGDDGSGSSEPDPPAGGVGPDDPDLAGSGL